VKLEIKCIVCGETVWVRGWVEADVNAAGIHDKADLSEACAHILGGGDYEILREEYDDDD